MTTGDMFSFFSIGLQQMEAVYPLNGAMESKPVLGREVSLPDLRLSGFP